MPKGKVNIYCCGDCFRQTVTLDLHEGATPFLTCCHHCNGLAQSSFYRVPQNLDADIIWIRPTIGEIVHDDHVKKGGLIPMPTRLPLTPINLQWQPNRSTCAITAFAMVLNVPVAELIEQIGHDGMEIAFPELTAPNCYRGHHIQELIHACFQRGYAVTPFEPMPVIFCEEQEFNLPVSEWIPQILSMRHGVLVGKTLKGNEHAIAWDGKNMYNPATGHIGDVTDFLIRTFYAVTPFPAKIKSD